MVVILRGGTFDRPTRYSFTIWKLYVRKIGLRIRLKLVASKHFKLVASICSKKIAFRSCLTASDDRLICIMIANINVTSKIGFLLNLTCDLNIKNISLQVTIIDN